MKKTLLLSLATPLFFMAAEALEPCKTIYQTNFYTQFLAGANFLQDTSINGNKAEYETGYLLSGSFGNTWRHYGLSAEFEYAYRRNAISEIDFVSEGSSNNGHFQSHSYMGNLLWEIIGGSFWKIQPYIGGGIGYDFEYMHSSNSRIVFNQSWSHFAWQVMAGFSYPIFRSTDIALEYKYHEGSHFNSNSIGMALVYKFGYIK